MKLEQMLNSSGSGSLLDGYNQAIIDLQNKISGYGDDKAAQLKRYSDFMGASSNWGKPAWEDSEKELRKGAYQTFYNTCVALKANPCLSRNESTRKKRYQERLAKARGYWETAQLAKAEASRYQGLIDDTQDLLTQAEADKAAYAAATAQGAAQGQDPAQIDALYQQQLDNLKAEKERLEAEKRAAEKNPNTKYFIIGGIALVGLIAFLALRKRK